jgi:hypothetical protein
VTEDVLPTDDVDDGVGAGGRATLSAIVALFMRDTR